MMRTNMIAEFIANGQFRFDYMKLAFKLPLRYLCTFLSLLVHCVDYNPIGLYKTTK